MIKTLIAADRSERERFRIPRSVQQSIPIQRSIGTASGKPAASSAAHGASQTSTMHWPPMRIREICLRPIAAH